MMIQVDLQMPEACDVCPFNYDFCGCQAMKPDDPHWYEWGDTEFDFTKRPDWCPLHDEHEVCVNCPMNPIRPTWQQGKAYCGQCGKRIPLKIKANYCHKCGREINWLP